MKSGDGEADYLLFLDGVAAGVVEAKKEGDTLTGVEIQTEKYSEGLLDSLCFVAGEESEPALAARKSSGSPLPEGLSMAKLCGVAGPLCSQSPNGIVSATGTSAPPWNSRKTCGIDLAANAT